MQEKPFLLGGCLSTGPGCPDRLWSLHPWWYAEPGWTRLWATSCTWPSLEQAGSIRCIQRLLLTSAVLQGGLEGASAPHWIMFCDLRAGVLPKHTVNPLCTERKAEVWSIFLFCWHWKRLPIQPPWSMELHKEAVPLCPALCMLFCCDVSQGMYGNGHAILKLVHFPQSKSMHAEITSLPCESWSFPKPWGKIHLSWHKGFLFRS